MPALPVVDVVAAYEVDRVRDKPAEPRD
eukprot:COSAG02_NODE_39329_length_418_cov_1.018809_2_plen_27_part_01